MRSAILAIFFSAIFALAPEAYARNTEHFFPAQEAADSELGRAKLFGEAFYLKGQKHPKVAKSIGEYATDQSTRGAFRTDEASCQVAFLSAIRELQVQAQRKGGNAIIDIVSTTRGKRTESATNYRCIAGSAVVHVGLKGKIVKLAP